MSQNLKGNLVTPVVRIDPNRAVIQPSSLEFTPADSRLFVFEGLSLQSASNFSDATEDDLPSESFLNGQFVSKEIAAELFSSAQHAAWTSNFLFTVPEFDNPGEVNFPEIPNIALPIFPATLPVFLIDIKEDTALVTRRSFNGTDVVGGFVGINDPPEGEGLTSGFAEAPKLGTEVTIFNRWIMSSVDYTKADTDSQVGTSSLTYVRDYNIHMLAQIDLMRTLNDEGFDLRIILDLKATWEINIPGELNPLIADGAVSRTTDPVFFTSGLPNDTLTTPLETITLETLNGNIYTEDLFESSFESDMTMSGGIDVKMVDDRGLTQDDW